MMQPFRFAKHITPLSNGEGQSRRRRLGGGLLVLCGLGLLVSCSADSFDFSSMHAYLVLDNSIHQDATLQSALNPMSPGVFCRISETLEQGTTYFVFESNQGGTPTRKKATADDMRRTRDIGIYNKTGVIVGYGNLSSPATLYAYDSQCPNCYTETNMANFRLTMDTRGIATCAKCRREYDLNNNGLSLSGGKKLIKYRVACTGPLGVLSINN